MLSEQAKVQVIHSDNSKEYILRNLVTRVSEIARRSRALQVVAAAFATMAVMTTSTYAADAFAPAGTKATLGVDYVYESAGKKRSEGMYDPYEWSVKRSASLRAGAGHTVRRMRKRKSGHITASQSSTLARLC